MADKLSQGSTFDIGVIGMQGKGTETQKTALLTAKNKTKKHQIKSQLKKKI